MMRAAFAAMKAMSYAASALQNVIANGVEQDESVASDSVNDEAQKVKPKEDNVKEGTVRIEVQEQYVSTVTSLARPRRDHRPVLMATLSSLPPIHLQKPYGSSPGTAKAMTPCVPCLPLSRPKPQTSRPTCRTAMPSAAGA